MNISKTLIAATLAVGVVGATTVTASASPFAPQPQVIRTAAMCDDYAKEYANWTAGHRGTRAVIGGAIGFVAGGLLFGTPVLGAAAGVATQAIIRGPQWQAEYSYAYGACVSGAPLPQPWAL
jgi:hypothetical protein